ncbi:hypothetical protein GCM10022224_078690 [Nonomuraea antimicrobica]|uniref:Uncharacterized protein n=1 Tax=Nonomuraea antimicrobica TaxID=561173 RepID=A0ABP7D999_9ACTN
MGAGEVFGEEAEDEGGAVGVFDGLAGWAVAVQVGHEGGEPVVEVQAVFFPEGADDRPDSEDLGEAGYVENGVRPHRVVGIGGVEQAAGSADVSAVGVAYSPDGAGVDPVADAFAEEVFDAVPLGRHGMPFCRCVAMVSVVRTMVVDGERRGVKGQMIWLPRSVSAVAVVLMG